MHSVYLHCAIFVIQFLVARIFCSRSCLSNGVQFLFAPLLDFAKQVWAPHLTHTGGTRIKLTYRT